MRDSFDAVVEAQRVELARVLSSFNVRVIIRGYHFVYSLSFKVAVNLDTHAITRETQKDVRALLLNSDKDEFGVSDVLLSFYTAFLLAGIQFLKLHGHDIKRIEANQAGSIMTWFANTTNVRVAGYDDVLLYKEYHDLKVPLRLLLRTFCLPVIPDVA